MSVRAVRDASAISAKSEAGALDLRTTVTLAEGAVTVAGVTWSATAWGEVSAENVTLGYTNETTGATGLIATDLDREGAADVNLPKKDGDYKLTHSTGGLTSFVTFTVTGYPLGGETNPWEIGAGEDPASVTAVSNDTGTVFFKPARGTVTKAGLEAVTNAMGGADFPAKIIAADGSETNDLVMVLGASGATYDNLADALAANEASYSLFEVPMRTVAIPAATAGYAYVASNETAGAVMTGDLMSGTNSYKVVDGEVVKVYFTLTDGYRYVGEVTNPMDLGAITSDRTVAALPSAVGLMGVAAFGAVKTYDGEPTNVTYVVTNYLGAAITDAAVYLREQGGEWVPVADFAPYRDVTNATVEVKAEKSGFETATNAATVVIAPRTVTLTSATDSWLYDGQAHSNVAVTAEGFVDGEGVTTNGFATITEVGSVPNAFTYAFAEGTLAANYNVTCVTGTLAVTGLWTVTLPTVAHATCVASTNGVALAPGEKVLNGTVVTFTLTPDAGYVLEGPSVYTATATGDGVTVTETISEPTKEPEVVFCRIAGAVDTDQLARCSEFAAVLRSVTRTDETVEIPVDRVTGAFDVADIPAGTWQVAVYGVRKDGKEFQAVEAVEIRGDVLAFELPMPDLTQLYVVSTAVEVDDAVADEFAAVGANGLKELAAGIAAEEADETNDVKVVLKVEAVDVTTNANAQAIAEAFAAEGNTNELAFVELTVLKQVGEAAPEQVGELPQCVEVVIPYPTRGRSNFAVWSSHNGEVAPLRRVWTFNGDEEGFVVGDGKIIVHAKRFSTYAIGSEAGEDIRVLHPNGDGKVFVKPTKATVYEGVTLDETGAVAGTVTVKLGKPNKKGEMTVSATVKTLADKKTYTFKTESKKVSADVSGPLALTLVGKNRKSKEHTFSLAIEGDSLTGAFDACTVDGARNVFKVKNDPKRNRLEPFVGYWTFALGTATSVEATSVEATCWAKVSKSGSVHVHGRLADGTLICCHPKAEVGDGWIAAPATVRKVVKGQVKTFVFRVAFDEATRTVSAVNVSPVVIADKKTLAVVSETPVTAVEGGQPKLAKAAVKTMTFGAEGREAPVKSSVRLNATRGELTGTLTWKTPNAKGRMVSETGKVYGIDIDGVLYGSVFFSKTGETRALVVGGEF